MHRFPDWSRRTAILLFWLFLWHLASLAVQNQILLVGPLDALKALAVQLDPHRAAAGDQHPGQRRRRDAARQSQQTCCQQPKCLFFHSFAPLSLPCLIWLFACKRISRKNKKHWLVSQCWEKSASASGILLGKAQTIFIEWIQRFQRFCDGFGQFRGKHPITRRDLGTELEAF